jgi:tetratricopeptide (TPR) repeat protein
MKRRARVLVYVAFAGLLLSFFSQTATAQVARSRTIRGQIFMEDGTHGPSNLDIELEMSGAGALAHTRTDGLGKFEFAGLRQQIYYVRVRHPDYYEMLESIDLSMIVTGSLYIRLRKIPTEQAPIIPPEGPGAVLDVTGPPTKAVRELNRGKKKLEGGDPQSAIAHFEKALSMHPRFPEAHRAMGLAYMDLENFTKGAEELSLALQQDPNGIGSYLALGVCYNGLADYVAAEAALLKVLGPNPEAQQIHYELARAYWGLKRSDDAERHARKAVALKANFAPGRVVLGNILLQKKEFAGALQEFREYLRLDPSGPMVADVRSVVSQLERLPQKTNQ